jgi:hypothetical protein
LDPAGEIRSLLFDENVCGILWIQRTEFYGYRTLVPEDYWDFFRKAGVSSVIRLNKKMYERRRFLDGGFRHHEL